MPRQAPTSDAVAVVGGAYTRKQAVSRKPATSKRKGKSTSAEERIEECVKNHHHELDLSTLNLGAITIPLSNFGSLTQLFLFKNNLEVLPDLSSLMLLEILDISRNNLTSLKNSGIAALSRLSRLDLNRNHFEVFPPEIVELQELETLIFHRNKLQNIDGIGKLKRLKALDFSYNALTVIPQETEELLYLEDFNLMHNDEIVQESLGTRTRRFYEMRELCSSKGDRRELVSRALGIQEAVIMKEQATILTDVSVL